MRDAMARNILLYRWSRFLRSLLFWQAVWFLYFQDLLSPAEAILLYVVFDVAVTVLEVPSGYMSDRLGRRPTLILSAVAAFMGAALLGLGNGFWAFAAAQVLVGIGGALASGTEESLLYESLAASGRAEEIEQQEVIAWRYSFAAFAISAVAGGLMSQIAPRLPFLATALAMAGLLAVTLAMREPPHENLANSETIRFQHLKESFQQPVLKWIFVLWVLMYAFSHIPFVFGQPFILRTLEPLGIAASAPLISGVITALMMITSVVVSLVAVQLRARLGLATLLLGAFALQIAITGIMAATDAVWVLAVLLLRMVPDALSRPFILARIQPLLNDDSRATWLSLKSLVARLSFAVALSLAAVSTGDVGRMPHADIAQILTVAAWIGAISLVLLALTARQIGIETPKRSER